MKKRVKVVSDLVCKNGLVNLEIGFDSGLGVNVSPMEEADFEAHRLDGES